MTSKNRSRAPSLPSNPVSFSNRDTVVPIVTPADCRGRGNTGASVGSAQIQRLLDATLFPCHRFEPPSTPGQGAETVIVHAVQNCRARSFDEPVIAAQPMHTGPLALPLGGTVLVNASSPAAPDLGSARQALTTNVPFAVSCALDTHAEFPEIRIPGFSCRKSNSRDLVGIEVFDFASSSRPDGLPIAKKEPRYWWLTKALPCGQPAP
jgi:hypothetical protein